MQKLLICLIIGILGFGYLYERNRNIEIQHVVQNNYRLNSQPQVQIVPISFDPQTNVIRYLKNKDATNKLQDGTYVSVPANMFDYNGWLIVSKNNTTNNTFVNHAHIGTFVTTDVTKNKPIIDGLNFGFHPALINDDKDHKNDKGKGHDKNHNDNNDNTTKVARIRLTYQDHNLTFEEENKLFLYVYEKEWKRWRVLAKIVRDTDKNYIEGDTPVLGEFGIWYEKLVSEPEPNPTPDDTTKNQEQNKQTKDDKAQSNSSNSHNIKRRRRGKHNCILR